MIMSITQLTIIIFFFIFIYFFLGFFLFLTITAKNPISAILYLIIFFFGLSILFIFCGADYMGILFLLLYAGAISIIFLFVIMFLDMKEEVLKKEKFSKLSIITTLIFFIVTFIEILKSAYKINIKFYSVFYKRHEYIDWAKVLNEKNNMEALGNILYQDYLFQFLFLGLILFLIMVIIISLLINYNKTTKKQILHEQLKKNLKPLKKIR